MASAYGVVAAGHSNLVVWTARSSVPTSHSSQVKAASADPASTSSSSPKSSLDFLTFSRRHLRNHGGVLNHTRRRIRFQIAAEGGEGEEPQEAVSERWSLEELDKQLKVLSSRESSAPRQVPVPRQTLGNSDGQDNAVNKDLTKLQWPTFSTGFFVFAAIGLVLLTIVNNVLYTSVLGPRRADQEEPFKTSVPVTPRFRITSLQQEREEREAKEVEQKASAAQSSEAPRPSIR